MGANTSREDDDSSYNGPSYQPTSSNSGNHNRNTHTQPSYSYPSQYEQNYPVQEAYPAYPPPPHHVPAPAAPVPAAPAVIPAPAYGGPPHRPQNKFDRRYSTIADSYHSLEQVLSLSISLWYSDHVDNDIFFLFFIIRIRFCMSIVLVQVCNMC